jgi:hypothetical protein
VLLDRVYVDTYLGMADRMRSDAGDLADDRPFGYRNHQDILMGDPFVDAMSGEGGDSCASRGSCGDCTSQPSCGWCAATGECATGTSSGPNVGACADWDWTSSACPGDTCAGQTSCADCTRLSSCGWCASTGVCAQGTSTGPSTGSCSDWDWVSTSCS